MKKPKKLFYTTNPLMSHRKIISYSIIRFMPYPELGEFVNVGIVALCHNTCKFDFILNDKHKGRVNNFFQELDKDYFSSIVHDAIKTLESLKKSVMHVELFKQFTDPIESVLYYEFPAAKIIYCDFAEALEDLHRSLILRQGKQLNKFDKELSK